MIRAKKILIVYDEENTAESLKLLLSDKYDLILTHSADQCLQILKNDKNIFLVLLDNQIPAGKGEDILARIKQSSPSVKVALISGYKSAGTPAPLAPPAPESRAASNLANAAQLPNPAARPRAEATIMKPFRNDEVLQTIAKLC
ncbi:MAG: response regulator [Candidatus Omnitrophica bacterium]|nr:response regulator [Candidatus Omnitrophota bacterium]